MSAFPHDCLPLWSSVRDLGSPRDLCRRQTELRGLVRGVPFGRGGAVRALLATDAPGPCASNMLWKPEAFFLRGLGPPKTERVWGVASVARSVPGGVYTATFFGSGEPESVYANQCASKRMGFLGTELQQAIVSWCYLLIARSHMYDICVFWRWLKTWGLKCSEKTPGNPPRAKARPTQDGWRGFQRPREQHGECREHRFRRKPEAFKLHRGRRSLGKVPKVWQHV